MKRVLGTMAIVLLSLGAATAQVTLRGKVVNASDGTPIPGAYVMINAAAPNVAQRTSLTSATGEFSVVSREAETTLTISFVGMANYVKKIEPTAGNNVNLGTIRLATKALQAGAVEIKALTPMAVVKGDTLQYNAAAFKTNPDASSEDLLKKMPGVTTNDDGAVEVHGEVVGKVYVDGKEFFANDPAVALKTLPADVVESMQIFDDKSDEARFSGFDDGVRVKAINIITKSGVSTSTFGKAYAGYGTDDRYSVGLAANIFNANQRWTILGQSNNVNNQGFTLNDIASSMSQTGGRGMGGGSDASQFTTGVRGGIQQTTMAGLNYQGEFKKVKIGSSYFFNNVNADQNRTREQHYISMPRDYFDTTTAKGYNYEHRFNARIEWNPNETNRIFFAPGVTYSTNHGASGNFSETLMNSILSNSAANRYSTDLGTYNAELFSFWMHRFKKAGRTLSVGGMFGGGNGWGDRGQESLYGSLDDLGQFATDAIDQIGTLSVPQINAMGRITYAEPLSKSSRIQVSYNLSYNKTESEKMTYNYNPSTQEYDLLDPLTSNLFNRNQTRQRGSLGYNLVKDKIVLNATATYQYSLLNDDQTFPQIQDNTYNFQAFVPQVRLEYKPSTTKTLTVNYERNSSAPNVTQLQNVLDISNPLQVFYGNPNLGQSYNDELSIRYNSVNLEKSTFWQLRARGGLTQDYIAYSRRFLTQDETIMGTTIVKGAQVSTPVNLNGYATASLSAMYSFPLTFMRSKMSLNGFYSYRKTPSMEDNVVLSAKRNDVGGNVSVTSNISEKVDFTFAYRPSVGLTTGSSGSFDRYLRHDVSAFANLFLVKGLFINADATWRNTLGTQESYSQHYMLVNAGIGYKFMKFQQAEFRLTGYDLLNQNRAFWQSSYDTYTEINTTNILKRYFMLSFTYKFDTRKGRTQENFGTDERSTNSWFGSGQRGSREGSSSGGTSGGTPPPPSSGGGGMGGSGGGGPR